MSYVGKYLNLNPHMQSWAVYNGKCAIWTPRDNDSSITTSPAFPNNNSGEDIDSSYKIYSRSEWGSKSVIASGMSGLRTESLKYLILHDTATIQSRSDFYEMIFTQNYHQQIDWRDKVIISVLVKMDQ